MSNPHPKLPPQVVGNAGLYYVCFKLSQLGWNVMPTARNAKGIDLVAYSKDASQYVGVQVKSLSKRAAVPVGTSVKSVMGDYWIVVVGVAGDPSAYVIPSTEIKSLAHETQKDGRTAYWIEPRSFDQSMYKEAWERIGAPESAA